MKKPTRKQSCPDPPFLAFDSPLELVPLANPLLDRTFSLQNLQDDKTDGPVICVTDGHGGPDPFAFHRVLAVMLYPRDEATRREFLSVVAKLLPRGKVTAFVQTAAMDNWWAGITAGRVLWWKLWLAHQYPPASVGKAVFLVAEEKKVHGKAWAGPTSKRRIKGAWEDYKPVAHLWAVLGGYFAEQRTLGSYFEADTLIQFPNLPMLLAFAESLRRLGRECFNLTEAWRLPPDLRLPGATIRFPPLPLWAVTTLKSYHA